jgi:hypothetical protein
MKPSLVSCIETDESAIDYPDNPLMGSLKTIVCRVHRLKALARAFYFEVLISLYTCPAWGKGLTSSPTLNGPAGVV